MEDGELNIGVFTLKHEAGCRRVFVHLGHKEHVRHLAAFGFDAHTTPLFEMDVRGGLQQKHVAPFAASLASVKLPVLNNTFVVKGDGCVTHVPTGGQLKDVFVVCKLLDCFDAHNPCILRGLQVVQSTQLPLQALRDVGDGDVEAVFGVPFELADDL